MAKREQVITTKAEFNEKYKAYLSEGYYGLAIDLEPVVIILDDIFKSLTKIPEFKFQQIKVKFGKCRFYTNLDSRMLESSVESKINRILVDIEAKKNLSLDSPS